MSPLARRLVMLLFAMIWLPAGVYASFAYVDLQYVPPVFFDELERSGRQAAAQADIALIGRMPNSGMKFEWRPVPGTIQDVITLNARCTDLTIVSQASPNEAPQRALVESAASIGPSTGRPLLAVPYIGLHQTPGKYVTTAWNAGRDAPQSIGNARLILERLAVNPYENRDEPGAIPCSGIARNAARRGVRGEAAKTMGNGINVSDVLLSQVSDTESNLLAMTTDEYTHALEN